MTPTLTGFFCSMEQERDVDEVDDEIVFVFCRNEGFGGIKELDLGIYSIMHPISVVITSDFILGSKDGKIW